MKIHHTYHHHEERIEIVTQLEGKPRLAALGLFAAFAAWTVIAFRMESKATATWVPGTLAFMALAIALGRLMYLIKPGSHVRLQLRLLGLPVFSVFIDAAKFHSIEIIREDSGSVNLRFENPAGQPVLTIEGFPDVESAGQVAALFHLDENHRKKAADKLIDDIVVAERRSSPWFGWGIIVVAFCLIPGLALMFGEGMDGLGTYLIVGFFLVLSAAYGTSQDSGIIAISKGGGYIDRWERRRLFQRIEYRQSLAGESDITLLGIRYDFRYLIIALLVLGQLSTIYLIIRRNEIADSIRHKKTQEVMDRFNDEDVRKGAEKFQELLKQRKSRADGQQDE
ncbi:MAG: hypothetical protein V4819_14870 [Verrucomicrobiota bacterium]